MERRPLELSNKEESRNASFLVFQVFHDAADLASFSRAFFLLQRASYK